MRMGGNSPLLYYDPSGLWGEQQVNRDQLLSDQILDGLSRGADWLFAPLVNFGDELFDLEQRISVPINQAGEKLSDAIYDYVEETGDVQLIVECILLGQAPAIMATGGSWIYANPDKVILTGDAVYGAFSGTPPKTPTQALGTMIKYTVDVVKPSL